MANPDIVTTPVLIVGGGPVGLSLALDLACRGQRSILIEQDAGTAIVPLAKAGIINERSMEFCRRWGIAEEVATTGFPSDHKRDTVYCTSLNGYFIGRDASPSYDEQTTFYYSPELLRKCSQMMFDPMLARAVGRKGLTDIRYSTKFERLTETADGVDVEVSDVTSGERSIIRAQYVVACDGAHSPVRRQLDIGWTCHGMDFSISLLLRIPHLEQYHPLGRGERYMFIGTNGTWGNLTTIEGRELWRLTLLGYDEKVDVGAIDFTPVIRRALGRDDVPVEIVRVLPWRRSQCLAETFRIGRVLLAGDACHLTSPTGGHGLNTGLGDSAGASWMLDALLAGWGGPGLLDAYSKERKPVGDRNISSSTGNYNAWTDKSGCALVLDDTPKAAATRRNIGARLSLSLKQEWYSQGIVLGYRYEGSPVIVPDGTPEPPDEPTEYIPTARPGHRAPHAWLADGRSMIDLYGTGFVLVRFDPTIDVAPLVAAAKAIGMPFTVEDIDQAEIASLYRKPLVLVRPDGHVAWRDDALPTDPRRLLDIMRGAN